MRTAANGGERNQAASRAGGIARLTVVVNGEQKEIGDGTTVSEFVASLGLKPDRLAIEVNMLIVKRGDWASTPLKDGDKVEIVHFVGGGVWPQK